MSEIARWELSTESAEDSWGGNQVRRVLRDGKWAATATTDVASAIVAAMNALEAKCASCGGAGFGVDIGDRCPDCEHGRNLNACFEGGVTLRESMVRNARCRCF